MSTYRLQVSLQDDSGLPRDQYVNTWFVNRTGPATQQNLDDASGTLSGFYGGIAANYSKTIAATGHTIKAYLVGAPLDSPPEHVFTMSMTAGTGPALPNEVACCFSYHGSIQPGIERASWRGRVYLGPLAVTVMDPAAVGAPVIAGTFLDSLNTKGLSLNAAWKGYGWTHVVFSKKLGQIYPVATYSCDNEFDTVRSRGLRASSIRKVTVPGGGGSSGSF